MSSELLGIAGWIALQLAIGVWASRNVRTVEDYLVAGRRLGYPLATATVFATWFGAETCIGAAGQAASEGLAGTRADPFGYAMCLLLMGLFLARALWRRKLQTLADLYRARFGVGVERLAVAMMVPTSVLWAAAQIRAFGQVLAASSALEVHAAIAIAAAVVIVYTMFGGMLADATTDLFQGAALVVGLLILGGVIWTSEAGAHARIAPELLRWVGPEDSALTAVDAWAVPVIGSLISAELVTRVSAARSGVVAQRATLAAAAIYLGIGMIPVGIGLASTSLLGPLEHPEQVLVIAAQQFLPPALATVFAGALVAAILSTVDSALLVSGAMVGHNVLQPLLRIEDPARQLQINRAAVVVFGVVAWILAVASDGVYALVEQASGLGTSGLFVAAMVALAGWRRGGPRTAAATLLTGLVVYIGGEFGEWYPAPFLLSLLASVGVYGVGAWWERQPAT